MVTSASSNMTAASATAEISTSFTVPGAMLLAVRLPRTVTSSKVFTPK